MNRANQRATAFTLIELLVVVAIIALLAAILFPVFSRARENARRASCQSNLHQFGLAFTQYIQDFDGAFPTGGTSAQDGTGWGTCVFPYLQSISLFQCPSDSYVQAPYYPLGAAYPPMTISYMYNNNLAGFFNWTTSYVGCATACPPVLDAQLPQPTRTVLLLEQAQAYFYPTHPGYDGSASTNGNDQRGYNNGGLATGQLSGGVGAGTNQSGLGSIGRHLDGANYLAADGHVKWTLGQNVSAGRNNWYPQGGNTLAQMNSDQPEAESVNYTGVGVHLFTMSGK